MNFNLPNPAFLAATTNGGASGTIYQDNAVTLLGNLDIVGQPYTQVRLPNMTTISGYFSCEGLSLPLTQIYAPALAYIGGNLLIHNNSSLTNVSIHQLVSMFGFAAVSDSALVTLLFPHLTTVTSGYFDCTSATNLTSVSFPNVLFGNGNLILFSGCALSEASVDHILARCVASSLTTSQIILNGGTNSPPSAAGLADVATLQGAGCTVQVN